MMSTATKLDEARAKLARAEAALQAAAGRVLLPDDPGALSGIRRSTTARQARRDAASMNRAIDLCKEYEAACKRVVTLEARRNAEQREAAANAHAECDIDMLTPGDMVRYTRFNTSEWARVLRVNRKTVTLESAPGFDNPKINKDQIRETRSRASQEAT